MRRSPEARDLAGNGRRARMEGPENGPAALESIAVAPRSGLGRQPSVSTVGRSRGRRRRGALVCRILGAVGVAAAGGIHFQLWTGAYGTLSVIGPLFLLDALGSWLVALVLLATRWPIVAAAGVAIELGAIAGLALASTTGLFGFREMGIGVGGQILAAYGTEAVAALLLAGSVILARERPRGGREAPGTPTAPV